MCVYVCVQGCAYVSCVSIPAVGELKEKTVLVSAEEWSVLEQMKSQVTSLYSSAIPALPFRPSHHASGVLFRFVLFCFLSDLPEVAYHFPFGRWVFHFLTFFPLAASDKLAEHSPQKSHRTNKSPYVFLEHTLHMTWVNWRMKSISNDIIWGRKLICTIIKQMSEEHWLDTIGC